MMFPLTLKFGLHRVLRTDQRRKSRTPCICKFCEFLIKHLDWMTSNCCSLNYKIFHKRSLCDASYNRNNLDCVSSAAAMPRGLGSNFMRSESNSLPLSYNNISSSSQSLVKSAENTSLNRYHINQLFPDFLFCLILKSFFSSLHHVSNKVSLNFIKKLNVLQVVYLLYQRSVTFR